MKPPILAVLLLFLVTPGWCQTTESARTLFDQVWSLVESEFYRTDLNGVSIAEIQSEFHPKLEDSPSELVPLTNRALQRLKASHTQLFSDQDPLYFELLDVFAHGPLGEEIRPLFQGAPPSYPGILARITEGKVEAIVPGGPAASSELKLQDQILEADGAPFHPVESFRRVGEVVQLKVQRDGKTVMVEVVPQQIQPRQAFLQSIEDSAEIWEEPPYRLGYVRMWSYAGEPYQEKLKEVLLGKLARTDGLVLDLRGSWGGASPDFASLFGSQTELSMVTREGESHSLTSRTYNAPMVILIDGSVSSGKELLAYNLQKSGRAKLVGSPTRGAVLGGALHLLPDGHALYLAQADVTVDGRRLEGVGVTPDFEFFPDWHVQDGEDALRRQGKGELLLALLKHDLQRRWHWDQAFQPDLAADNQRWLKQVLKHQGWPSRELFGEKAQTAWLIVQHADNDLEFQKEAMTLLSQAVKDGKAPRVEQAYLEDRILINQGKPQLYGTQIEKKDGQWVLKPVVDPDTLEERRKSVGLPTVEEYLKPFR